MIDPGTRRPWQPEESSAASEALPEKPVVLSDIRPTRQGRLALFCRGEDGEERFLFSIDTETATLQHIRISMALTPQQLYSLRQHSDLRRAKDKALQLLSQREHAAGQLYEKLCRSFDADTAAATVAEMQRLALLDDAAFAMRRAQHLAARGKSRLQIRQDLAALHIERALIWQALEQLPADEEETLARLIERCYRTKLAQGKRETVYAALLRRGFSGTAVRRALAAFADEEVQETCADMDGEPPARDIWEEDI